MLCYSDYILAQKPFVYCRLNEPAGFNVYYDMSGNGNHMYDFTSPDIIQSATNRQSLGVTGDPDASGVIPLGTKFSYNQYSGSIPDPSPQIYEFPRQYTNHTNLGGNTTEVIIDQVWGDVIVGTNFEQRNIGDCDGGYEEIACWGPIRVTIKTLVDCSPTAVFDGFELSIWVSNSVATNPPNVSPQVPGEEIIYLLILQKISTATPFRYIGKDSVRYTAGVKQIDEHNIEFFFAEDGVVLVESSATIPDYDFFRMQVYGSSNGYSNAAVIGEIESSNYSYFMEREFPTADWLQDSQTALEATFAGTDFDEQVYLSRQTPGAPIVYNVPGSMVNLLDSNLLIGYDQQLVSDISVSGGTTVTATVYTPTGISITSHSFQAEDIIYIGGSSQSNLNGHWEIASIGRNTITFETDNTCTTQDFVTSGETVIVKRSPIGGGGRWVRTTSSSNVVYTSTDPSANSKQLIVSDNQEDHATVTMSDPGGGNESSDMYFRKNFKIVNSVNPNTSKWRMIGDGRRFYLFLAYRSETPSLVHVMIYGDIQDLDDSIWYTNLIAFKDSVAGNPGTNVAFQYPHWTILDTGHLQCELVSKDSSDVRWTRSTTGTNTYLIGYGDVGRHIYPIPVPYLEYTP